MSIKLSTHDGKWLLITVNTGKCTYKPQGGGKEEEEGEKKTENGCVPLKKNFWISLASRSEFKAHYLGAFPTFLLKNHQIQTKLGVFWSQRATQHSFLAL